MGEWENSVKRKMRIGYMPQRHRDHRVGNDAVSFSLCVSVANLILSFILPPSKITILAIALFCILPLHAQKTGSDSLHVFDLSRSGQLERLGDWKYRFGDNPLWALSDFDDQAWGRLHPGKEKETNHGIRWYRTRVRLEGEQNDFDILAMYFSGIVSAYEIYWDGRLIHRNGGVAAVQAAEIPGDLLRVVKLRREWTTPGIHTIAIRLSNLHVHDSFRYFRIPLGYLSDIRDKLNEFMYLQLFNIGVFFFACLFSFALFLGGGRQRPYLMFSLYCLASVLGIGILAYQLLWNINIRYADSLVWLSYIITPLSGVLLAIFFILIFEMPRKYYHMLIVSVLAVVPLLLFDQSDPVLVLLYASGMALYAIRKKVPGSLTALIGILGLLAMMVFFYWGVVWYVYTAGIVFFIFCVMLSISRQIKQQNQQHEAAKLRSARLETELLKKHIQPHFLMNTLLSIISWIREDPPTAIKLIQSLAEEFRMINQISSQTEIPLSDEVALCRTHLTLMGYRQDVQYALEAQNLPGEEKIPPMIFHTLIENGLTHAYRSGENGKFLISCERNNGTVHYRLWNDGSQLEKLSRQPVQQIEEGMGLKYVKARLEERYPHRWQMDYGLRSDGWEVNIIIAQH